MSEKSIARPASEARQTAKTSFRNPAISLGPALVANSLCPGQEKRTMRESEGQIGNSGPGNCRECAITFSPRRPAIWQTPHFQ